MSIIKREYRAFLRAFNADSIYLVDYDEIKFQTITTASYAAYKFNTGGAKPSVSQIVATRSALAYSTDGYVRQILKDLLDAEEFAF